LKEGHGVKSLSLSLQRRTLRGQVLQYYIYEWVSSIKKLAYSKFGMRIAPAGSQGIWS
jgi:hypothetical protein